MNDMQVFENPMLRCELRTLERDGEIWFVAADVCRALDLDRTQSRRLDDDEKDVVSIHTPGGPQDMTVINEFGLYSLILGSRKPEARAFKRWVTHEVLPAIRRTGRYSAAPERGDMTLSEAVRSLRDCAPEVRPCIHKLLTDMGFNLPALEPMQLGPSRFASLDKARFAEWFRQAYEDRGMTNQQVADALGTSRMQVYRWGHGVNYPREPYMRTITEYFGKCPEDEE